MSDMIQILDREQTLEAMIGKFFDCLREQKQDDQNGSCIYERKNLCKSKINSFIINDDYPEALVFNLNWLEQDPD